MKVIHIPCLEDNYSYLVIDEKTKQGAVVDPVEPEKVVGVAKENGVDLKLVLTTHHHWDHAGGNEKIKELVPGIKVYGGSVDNVKGHTKGHISYYLTGKEEEDPAVFTGDTLVGASLRVLTEVGLIIYQTGFVAGCGKFFEGTAEQMYQSLCVTLASLPKPTRVYCGHEFRCLKSFTSSLWPRDQNPLHEYTVKNLQFAQTVEPDNAKISQKLSWAQQQRQSGLPTIPSTIQEELESNPFMRADLPEVQERVGCKSPVEALREIRQRKDNWRG
ncbi:Beta-lactamase-like protein [Cynara cardunculus var. scolymus]|uniref:hydroxyacylglutathione hydrolase n=1 Tax=Cynara cardunculus var. scolymus TaxID=59895 RepID=A0A103YJ95_CYNCS|nr:Beta-lactamase-like protein [Cynara cardunculus var. scolymus]